MRPVDLRYALWGAALLLLLATPVLAGFAGAGWEISQWAGLAGTLACIVLAGAPIRPRDSTPPTLLSLQHHTLIGWLALALVVLHAGGLVLADRTVIEYLKPTAPLYQFAGIAASVLLGVLVLTGGAGPRRRLWKSHRGFQAAHVVLGCAVCALTAVHVAVTARYLGGPGRRALFVAATIGAILMLLRARRPSGTTRPHPPRRAGPASMRRRQLVFGRHSTLIACVAAISAAVAAGLIPDTVGAKLREPLIRRTAALPLDFPHGKHGAVNCLTCHHNYADRTGSELCVACHRGARADLKEGAEARFHGFCFDCHRHPAATFRRHGPVSGCIACHRPPE